MNNFRVKHVTSEELYKAPFFSQAITVSGDSKTIYIGGQNALNVDGEIIGKDDLALQVKQTLHNIQMILDSQNATFNDLVKLNIYLVQGCDPQIGFGTFQEVVGPMGNPPLITVLFVSGLANPQFLIEIDGIAVVEEKKK